MSPSKPEGCEHVVRVGRDGAFLGPRGFAIPSNQSVSAEGDAVGKLTRTFSLMRASWEVLKQDKELLLFPLFSAVGCVLVLASLAGPII